MEKKIWTAPQAVVEQFMPNEYIAACWDIKCNVPFGIGYFEGNGIEGFQNNSADVFLAEGNGCDTVHQVRGVDAAGPAPNAMWAPREWEPGEGWGQGKPYEVFYFQANGYGTSNHHFCTLDSVNWDANPNASN